MNIEPDLAVTIRDFGIGDFEEALQGWKKEPSIGLSSADDRASLARFLKRNPGLSKVAVIGERVLGTALCGHDGRRGYIYHLWVAPALRRNGIGRLLISACLEGLRLRQISKCHLFIYHSNSAGKEFWKAEGWVERKELAVFSHGG